MKLIISPAKKMKPAADFLAFLSTPQLLSKTEQLKEYLQSLPFEELKRLLRCNDALAQKAYEQYQGMDLHQLPSPAILSYDGIQYQYMAPHVFDNNAFAYVEEHLRILSGFYGILRPFDGVVPYRLEMQAKLRTSFCRSLYDFWGESLAQALLSETKTVLNLASWEYAKAVKKHWPPDARFITCRFGQWQDGRVVEKGVYVKMARGEMVRYLAEHWLTTPEGVKGFDHLGYSFQEALSDETTYVFLTKHKKQPR